MTAVKTLTYLDACILIAAARGNHKIHSVAMEIIDDPNRSFSASEFLRLEVLPKPLYNKVKDEAEFYAVFFEAVEKWATNIPAVVTDAYNQGTKYGLSALDALHVAAAVSTGTNELVTAEKSTKPLSRVTAVKVVNLK